MSEPLQQTEDRDLDISPEAANAWEERLRKRGRELLERRSKIGVVLVGIADHQPGTEEDGHRLLERQLERRQERLGVNAPAAAVGPRCR